MQKHSSTDTVYVSFPLDDGSFENIHARHVVDDEYILDNSPFYVYDISFNDIVTAKISSERLLFHSVKKRGGHSTYRIKMPLGSKHSDFLFLFAKLKAFGCTFEGGVSNGRLLYSIDVPPNSDLEAVYRFLENAEKCEQCEFEEAHFFRGYH